MVVLFVSVGWFVDVLQIWNCEAWAKIFVQIFAWYLVS